MTLEEQLNQLEAKARSITIKPTGTVPDVPAVDGTDGTLPEITVRPDGVVPPTETGVPAVGTQPVVQTSDPAVVPASTTPAPSGAGATGNGDLETQLAALEKAAQGALSGAPATPAVTAEAPDPVTAALAGFNRNFAQVLGVVPEAANELLSYVGLGIWDPYQGKVPEYIAKRMQDLGIAVDLAPQAARSFSSRVGSETFNGLAMLSAVVAAAPTMAVRAGTTKADYIIRETGKIFQNNPKLAMVLELPSATGGVYGGDVGGPVGNVAGAMAGGMAGAGVIAGTQKVGRGIVSAGESIVNTIKGKAFATPGAPLRDPNIDPSDAKVFAESQVEDAKYRMATAMRDAVDRVPTVGTPEQMQAQTRKLMENAEKIATRIESEYWDKVPKKAPVPQSPVRAGIAALEKEIVDAPSSSKPTKFMEELKDVSMPKRDPETGRMMKALPSVEKMRGIVHDIRLARTREEGLASQGITPNWSLIRNYHKLETIVHDSIEQALPGDISIQQARRVSTLYHDLFSRGGIADVMATRGRGDPRINPEETMENLLGRFGGMAEIMGIRDKLATVPKPGGGFLPGSAASAAEQRSLADLQQSAEDSIRSMWREMADSGEKGPMQAAGWFAKHEKDIRPMARVHAELELASREITGLAEQEKLLRNSALSRFAGTDTEKFITSVWLSKDPGGQTKELMKTLSKDADALEGFRAGVVGKFINSSRADPMKAKELITTPRFRGMLEEALAPDQLKRLERIVDITYRIANGDEKLIRNILSPATTVFAQIIGAAAGRQVAHMTGGGTVQTPGIMANTFKKLAEKSMRTSDPSELLVNSVLDPKWERLTLNRIPVNTKEGRNTARTMRRIVGAIDGTRQAAYNSDGDSDDK